MSKLDEIEQRLVNASSDLVERVEKLRILVAELTGNTNYIFNKGEAEFIVNASKDVRLLLDCINIMQEALEFYGSKDTYKDVWQEYENPSEHFKYFYMFRMRTKDFDLLDKPYHYYAGKRAREALKKINKLKGEYND